MLSKSKEIILIKQQPTKRFGKKLAGFNTSINFCFDIQLLYSAQHYKFGNRNNNELLIINLVAVRDEF